MKKIIAIAGIAAFVLSSSTAFAFGGRHSRNTPSSNIDVTVQNEASVSNNVDTTASTGGNTANGGAAKSEAESEGGDADSLAAGGHATIWTGNARASSDVSNIVNTNDTKVVADCGCKGKSDIDVTVTNGASVSNTVDTKAKTGYNEATGGKAYSEAESEASHSHGRRGHSNSGDALSTSVGGDATIGTGDAKSRTSVVNVVNTNLTRVRK